MDHYIRAPLCWKQKYHSKQNQPNCTNNVGWIPLRLHPSCPMKGEWLVGNDWSQHAGIWRVAPNGIPRFCGTKIWPCLPVGCWVTGPLFSLSITVDNLPLLQADAHTCCFTATGPLSLFAPLAFLPLQHRKPLLNSLSNSWGTTKKKKKSLPLPNIEMSLMKTAVL